MTSAPAPTADELRVLDDATWEVLRDAVLAEDRRRQALTRAALEIQRLNAAYLSARDTPHTGQGETSPWPVWVRPTGPHDSYPASYQVTHGGRVWRSTVPANSTEPGGNLAQGLWEDVTDSPEPPEPGQGTAGDVPAGPGGNDDAPVDADADAGVAEPYTPPPAPAASPWEPGVPYYEGDMVAWQDTTWRVLTEHESTTDAPPHEAPGLYEPA